MNYANKKDSRASTARLQLAMLKAGRGEPSPQVEMQEVLDGGGEKKAPEPEKEVASV